MHDERPDTLRTHLHPKQWTAFLTPATEVLFGGAAGPGKSHLMRIAAIVWCKDIAGLQVYLFRRIREDLFKNHMDGPSGFRTLLASWEAAGWCRISGNEIRFWNGSTIYLAHCKNEKDIYQYQGNEIHVLMIDELTHFTEKMYRWLRSRVRKVGISIPKEYEGKFPRILCSANPGNIGHLWVRNTFIAGSVPLKVRRMPKLEGGMLRQFIPARLEDNPSMTKDDPDYEDRLSGLGSAQLVKAMRDGDWDVVEGAFFSEWSNQHHVLAPFAIPAHWLRYRSGDWGSASPFSIGWWAVVGDDYQVPGLGTGASPADAPRKRSLAEIAAGVPERSAAGMGTGKVILPRGAIIRYREDYGASGPNKGLKLTAEAVGQRIVKAEKADVDRHGQPHKVDFGVLDPSAFKEDGGPSIAERINDVLIKHKCAAFHEADNARVTRSDSPDRGGAMGGWDQMRSRLVGTAQKLKDGSVDWATGRPMLYVFSTCVDFIRTVPVLQHDPHRAEDLDTKAEDHAADDGRYGCMARPWIKSLPKDAAVARDAFQEAREERYTDSTAVL